MQKHKHESVSCKGQDLPPMNSYHFLSYSELMVNIIMHQMH